MGEDKRLRSASFARGLNDAKLCLAAGLSRLGFSEARKPRHGWHANPFSVAGLHSLAGAAGAEDVGNRVVAFVTGVFVHPIVIFQRQRD